MKLKKFYRKNESVTIEICGRYNDEKINLTARFLGAGMFSKCFESNGIVYSFVKNGSSESDYSKQAIALYADDTNPHIPQLTVNGDYNDGIIYTSPLYNPLTSKNKKAWSQYKTIKQAFDSVGFSTLDSDYDYNCKILNALKHYNADESIIEAFASIMDSCSNYGDSYRFESPKRNMATDNDGNLILLDVIFNTFACSQIRNEAIEARAKNNHNRRGLHW